MLILIVDDEFYARKALAQTIQDWEPSSEVIEAEDGQQALGILAAVRPDAVFSDIRMPNLDGIQLAAKIYELYPFIPNVIISGFDDFNYAQQAIACKVEQYLLKPVQKEELFKILESIGNKSKAAAARQIEIRLAALLFEDQTLGPWPAELASAHSFAVAVLQTDCLEINNLREIVFDALSGCGIECIHIRERKYANVSVVVLISYNSSATRELRVSKQLLKDVVMQHKEKTGSNLSIGVSRLHSDISAMPILYREANHAWLHRFVVGSESVHLYEETQKANRYRWDLFDEMMIPLYNKIVKHQTKEAADLITKLFDLIVLHELSIFTVQDVCAKLVAVLNSAIDQLNEHSSIPEPYLEQMELGRFFSMGELVQYFVVNCSQVAAKLEHNQAKADIVEEIKNYVEHNYHRDIVLEQLAKNMYFRDPSYLSRLFKKKHGTCFSKFLMSVRLDNAKRLMETGLDLSVCEIAEAVGFHDCSHFIQMYKKYFGETPGKYREHNLIIKGKS